MEEVRFAQCARQPEWLPEAQQRLHHCAGADPRERIALAAHRRIEPDAVARRQHAHRKRDDDPRRLDWRVLGRTDRPYIKEYDEETNLRSVLMLDASGSMNYRGDFGSKFDYATKLLASFAYLMLGQGEGVGVTVCSHERDDWLAPHGGPTQLSRVVDALERARPLGPLSAARPDREAPRVGRGSIPECRSLSRKLRFLRRLGVRIVARNDRRRRNLREQRWLIAHDDVPLPRLFG